MVRMSLWVGCQNALVLAVGRAVNNAMGGIPAAVNAAVAATVPAAVNAAVAGAIPAAVNAAVAAAMVPHTAAIDLLTAEVHNFRVRLHNREADRLHEAFQGIRKTVIGSGLVLATWRVPAGMALPLLTTHTINSVPALLLAATRAEIFALTHAQILSLIEFYNEDMGIQLVDP
ncbi:hypothetical protein B0H17DRAFT_106099 [Mycena rosella]|uniref:Uncharacterized protein n=1 Tax=Mycena rosella TaxID=1033263 RepID=A0AAD7D498_MYCRO|nr:hypothetical protein B0H17DRAFT_106099 [Mycena rosella]